MNELEINKLENIRMSSIDHIGGAKKDAAKKKAKKKDAKKKDAKKKVMAMAMAKKKVDEKVKLLSQGGFGCVYYPGFDCDGKADGDKKYVTKLQLNDVSSDNELFISEKIKKIDNYQNFFAPIESVCDIDLRIINNDILEKCEVVKGKGDYNKYTLMKIAYINQKNYFNAIRRDSIKNTYVIVEIFNSFNYLLTSLNLLIQNNIVHFDLKEENIIYNQYSYNPIIIDFGISIDIGKFNLTAIQGGSSSSANASGIGFSKMIDYFGAPTLYGNNSPEEILASVKSGLYAVNFGGGQVDITSGKFVFTASEAYLIENGKIGAPVKGATLIGNGPDALTHVKMIGDDMQLDPGVGTCGKDGQGVPVGVGQPTMLLDNLTVGGTAA